MNRRDFSWQALMGLLAALKIVKTPILAEACEPALQCFGKLDMADEVLSDERLGIYLAGAQFAYSQVLCRDASGAFYRVSSPRGDLSTISATLPQRILDAMNRGDMTELVLWQRGKRFQYKFRGIMKVIATDIAVSEDEHTVTCQLSFAFADFEVEAPTPMSVELANGLVSGIARHIN